MGRYDRSTTLTDQSGDPINVGNPLPTTSSGGGGGGGTSQADKSTFAEGSGIGTPIMGVFNDSLAAPVTEDRVAAVRITSYRGIHCNLRDDSGVELGTALSPLRVDPTGDTVQPVSGTVAVTDGGGSLTVDGTIAATQSGSWTVAATQSGSWSVSITGAVTVADLATADYDTGAGTVTQAMIGIALPASGGPVAGGTATNPIRTDPTGTTAQPVTDGGGSLTVDGSVSISGTVTVTGTVTATQSGTWAVQVTDGSLTASIRNTGSSDSLNVAIVDASGNQIVSFGGGVQYTEGDVDATPTGTAVFWWDDGNDTLHAASPSNPLPVDVTGTVTIADGGGSITVDGTVSISGTVTVSGTVAATQSGTWTVGLDAGNNNIGDVDVASLPAGSVAAVTAKTFDYDTGAGTDTVPAFGIALPASGGAVAGGTATNPVRVDVTGTTAQPVTDNGGSLTVDGTVSISGTVTVSGTVAATQSGTWSVRITDGTDTADVLDLTNSNPIAAAIVDANGDQITSFGGGTQYTEGDTDATPTGTLAMWWDTSNVLRATSAAKPLPAQVAGTTATASSLSGINPVYIGINSGSGLGRFATAIVSNRDTDGTTILGVAPVGWDAGSSVYRDLEVDGGGNANLKVIGAEVITDDASYTPASGKGVAMFALADETSTDSVDEGDAGIVRMSLDRILYQRGNSFLSTNNSTTSVLSGNAAFTGTADEVLHYAAVTVSIRASHAAATDGVSLEWSNDNSNWDRTEKFDYTAADHPFSVTVRPKGRYFRLVYTNGATLQTTFRVQTILHAVAPRAEPMSENGRVLIDGVTYKVKWAAINATASGDNTIISLVSGKKLRILGICHTSDGNVAIAYKSGASNTLISAMSFAKYGGPGLNDMYGGFWCETNAGEAFVMNQSAAVNTRGRCYYVEITA